MRSGYLVVIGASSGGLGATRRLLADVPADFPAPICIVIHTAPDAPGVLREILDRASPLRVVSPRDVERLLPGRVYVAPADHHLLVEPGRVRLTRGPKENLFRPAIDPLFRSAAQVFGPAAIGVVLTGNLDDGAAGLSTIKQLGGRAIVQDPDDALYPSMPRAALRHGPVDHVVRLEALAPLLSRLVTTPVGEKGVHVVEDHVEVEVNIAREQDAMGAGVLRLGPPSPFACPECHGVLLDVKQQAGACRYRCHTGHAYSIESLLSAAREATEAAMWNALRAVDETRLLMERMTAHLRERHEGEHASALEAEAREAERRRQVLRGLLGSHADTSQPTPGRPSD